MLTPGHFESLIFMSSKGTDIFSAVRDSSNRPAPTLFKPSRGRTISRRLLVDDFEDRTSVVSRALAALVNALPDFAKLNIKAVRSLFVALCRMSAFRVIVHVVFT